MEVGEQEIRRLVRRHGMGETRDNRPRLRF